MILGESADQGRRILRQIIRVRYDQPVTTSLMYAAKRLEQVIRARLDEMLKDSEVTTLQYTALTALADKDGISGARLARESFVTPQSMAEMLKLLQDRGYIRRETNPESRREYLVYITDAGRAFVANLEREAAALEARMVIDLTPREVAAFRNALALSWAALRDVESVPADVASISAAR